MFDLVDDNAHLKEELRQAQRKMRESVPVGHITSVGVGSVTSSRGPRDAARGEATNFPPVSLPEDVAELVKLRVEEGNARKRADLEASKARRMAESEAELKASCLCTVFYGCFVFFHLFRLVLLGAHTGFRHALLKWSSSCQTQRPSSTP